uniref:Olfactory receptor C family, r1 n=1 Tax=Lates calcarifer TaxID=8187 RepID=A0A4W6FEK8_LATCA
LKYMYVMAFAVEEINRNSTLLPGVKLGYRIFDSCSRYPWALQHALGCEYFKTCIIAVKNVNNISVSFPQISYFASCPCLSDRSKFPNFFRTIPSDIYQAWAMAQLAIRFHWTWIGAVIVNNDYGQLAIQVYVFVVTLYQCFYKYHLHIYNDLLQDLVTSKVASGVLGVAIQSSKISGFENYLRNLHPRDTPSYSYFSSSLKHPFTDTSQLRVSYNVYLAVYAAAHALHIFAHNFFFLEKSSLLNFYCFQLLQHLNKVNVTTPQGEMFYFQGADIPAKYDLVNWQNTPEGTLKLVLIGRVDGFDLILNESAIQWSTGSNQVPVSVCSESCPPGTRVATRKGEPVCCFDCIPCAEGEISNTTGSPHCERCPSEFWSDAERTACILRQVDFLSFNETLGITLATAAVSGATVTTAVFVVFLYYRQTPVVRANNSELSFLLLVSLKLCFLCSLVFIGRPSVWACRFQQAAFGISFVLCVSCLLVKTIVVLAVLIKYKLLLILKCNIIYVIICAVWLSLSPPVPQQDLGFQGSKVTLKCAMASVVGFSLVLGYIGLLACTCLLLAFLARKLPDNFNEAKLITFSMLIFCAVWVAFVPAYVSSPGKYVVAVEIFAILASSYGLLLCIFAPKCFIILLRPEKNTKKHLMERGKNCQNHHQSAV